MSLVIREISKDMKCKIKYADRYIHKAIEIKDKYPSLSKIYYDFSIKEIENMLIIHDEVEDLIEDYKKTKGTPPQSMLDYWNFLHQDLIEWIDEIKVLQDFYKKL